MASRRHRIGESPGVRINRLRNSPLRRRNPTTRPTMIPPPRP